VYLDEIFVPLVILAPGAPAGQTVRAPASLRDLPPTVVDLVGLSSDSPFPGGSLAAHWSDAAEPARAQVCSPALAEQADKTALQSRARNAAGEPVFKLSLVASGHHYIADGMGTEKLFDLRADRFEQTDLVKSGDRKQEVRVFRKMLLEVLTENSGSVEVEQAYLGKYRERLRALVEETGRTASLLQ
jgi:arylsulfatase A-like enzyme